MANRVTIDEGKFQQLKDKVIVLTGGANGIGAATVEKLCNAGAKVVFGDYDGAAGQRTAETLSNSKHAPMFVTMDVSKYEDNIKLFRTAFDKYQRVDHALAIAGIVEKGKWFDPALTIESVEQPETLQVMNINFVGVAYFTRIARVYLKHGMEQGEDKSIVLISSAAGCPIEAIPLSNKSSDFSQCSKHAVIGMLRSTRKIFYERDHIRINAICPAISDTNMTVSIIDEFKKSNQAINTAQDVAKYIVGLQVAPEMNGKAVYVEGGRGWEVETGIDETMPVWLGEEPTRRLREHLKTVGKGDGWKIE